MKEAEGSGSFLDSVFNWPPKVSSPNLLLHPTRTIAYFVSSSTSSIIALSCMSSSIKQIIKKNGKLSFRVLHVHDSVFHDFVEQFPFAGNLCILHHPWDVLHTLVFAVRLIRLVLAFYYFPVVHKEI